MTKYEALDGDEETHDQYPKKSLWVVLLSYSPWVIHGFVFFLSILFLLFSASLYFHMESSINQNPIYSPLNDVVEYRIETWSNEFNKDSPYTGPRRAELDSAWRNITHLGLYTASESDLKKIGKPSLRREDGTGYHTSIAVFHQLHCLDYLRKVIYSDSYTVINDNHANLVTHVDNCINALRLALQCYSDVGLITYGWYPGLPSPYPDFTTTHQCRNFEKIQEWALEHEANLTGQLSHPIFGLYVSPF